jgi:hypothetical protein
VEHLVDALAVVAHLTNIAVAVAGALWEIAPARACFAAVTFAKMKRFIPIWTSWLDGKVTTMAGCCTTATLKTANIITGGKTSLNAEWNINGNATHTLFRRARTASLSRLTCTYAGVVNANLAGAAVVDVGTLDAELRFRRWHFMTHWFSFAAIITPHIWKTFAGVACIGGAGIAVVAEWRVNTLASGRITPVNSAIVSVITVFWRP